MSEKNGQVKQGLQSCFSCDLSFPLGISLGFGSGLLSPPSLHSLLTIQSRRDIHLPGQDRTAGIIPLPRYSVIRFLFSLLVSHFPSFRSLHIPDAHRSHAKPTIPKSPDTFGKVFCFLLPRPADQDHLVLEAGCVLSISNIYGLPGNLLEDISGYDAKGIADLCLKKVIAGMIYEGQQAQ